MGKNVVNITSAKKTQCATDLLDHIKNNQSDMTAAILLHADANGELSIEVVGDVQDLEVIGWLNYSAMKLMCIE